MPQNNTDIYVVATKAWYFGDFYFILHTFVFSKFSTESIYFIVRKNNK